MGERISISVLARNRFCEDKKNYPPIMLDYRQVAGKQASVMLVFKKKQKRNNRRIKLNNKNSKQSNNYSADERKLRKTIDELKEKLHKLVKSKGLSDQAVITLSQELDKYILEYQLIMRNGEESS